ncbi:MAG: hypothetical protein EXX96DRAFT_487679 [Benjaminiella poitrasii]|nr:MAG: hypothetical protein EXX96DRAFT_487679 [Benjaminiella poitrasii]
MEQIKATIFKLPNEILQHIFHISSTIIKREDHLLLGWTYPEHSYDDLKSIASCCKRFYILCAPLLWKDKEFILPYETDEMSKSPDIQMATDILGRKALFQASYHLGDYVRSLSRDLTQGIDFDLANTQLMAQLVKNLRALRIDFHFVQRKEHYGLRYFFEHCPQLKELYLRHCQDIFDDFTYLVEYKPALEALTLSNCTIRQITLSRLAELFKSSLQRILLEYVLIEPPMRSSRRQHQISDTFDRRYMIQYTLQDFLGPDVTEIPLPVLQSLLINHPYLTQFALTTDSISFESLKIFVSHMPLLEKLSIALHEVSPYYLQRSLETIAQLSHLTTLSIVFKQCGSLSRECTLLACHAPAPAWTLFAGHFPRLRLLHISARRIVVTSEFLPVLFDTSPHLKYVMIHNLALALPLEEDDSAEAVRNYMKYCKSITYQISAWDKRYQDDLYTFTRAMQRGFDYFDERIDHICFIKGFPPSSLNDF